MEELLDGKKIEMPPIKQLSVTFKTAPKAKNKKSEQHEFILEWIANNSCWAYRLHKGGYKGYHNVL